MLFNMEAMAEEPWELEVAFKQFLDRDFLWLRQRRQFEREKEEKEQHGVCMKVVGLVDVSPGSEGKKRKREEEEGSEGKKMKKEFEEEEEEEGKSDGEASTVPADTEDVLAFQILDWVDHELQEFGFSFGDDGSTGSFRSDDGSSI